MENKSNTVKDNNVAKKITIGDLDGNTVHIFEHGSCQCSTRPLNDNEKINTERSLNKFIRSSRIPILAMLGKAKA